ncbi:MAG: tRNA (adenosine(37)-N6)-threonylcarbamoyltransferase complex ATPase subunit type 1 TsaE [bacterium]|nr:tRNA (adenosine(37)-N6)-threonylcarbamoyltransferase complex ATPase subunit type 1 TsaE [bacterium]
MKDITHSAQETVAFGKKIATQLKPGDLFLLKGDLGAGKTTFVQGIAEGLNATKSPNSPSFTILQEYNFPGGIFRHLDLYRLDNPEIDVDTLGLPELLTDEQAITVVEWPERLKQMWKRKGRTIEVNFSYGKKEGEREVSVEL